MGFYRFTSGSTFPFSLFLRPLSAQMLSGPDVRTRQHFNSWLGPIRQQTKSNRFFFFLYPRSQIRFLSSAVCFCNQVTLQNQTMPFILFICRPLPQLLFPPLLSSFPSLLCLPSPPCFTQPTLRTFYSVQNINLSSRGVITLSSRAAAALFKCCLFFFSSICFHFTSLPQYLLPPFLFSPLVSIS